MTYEEALQCTIGDLIEWYRSMERAIDVYMLAVKQELQPTVENMATAKAAIMQKLIDSKQESASSQTGRASISTAETVSVHDWEAFHAFVEEMQEHDFLVKGAAPAKVKEYRDMNNGKLPPGVTISRMNIVNIRKA